MAAGEYVSLAAVLRQACRRGMLIMLLLQSPDFVNVSPKNHQ